MDYNDTESRTRLITDHAIVDPEPQNKDTGINMTTQTTIGATATKRSLFVLNTFKRMINIEQGV